MEARLQEMLQGWLGGRPDCRWAHGGHCLEQGGDKEPQPWGEA